MKQFRYLALACALVLAIGPVRQARASDAKEALLSLLEQVEESYARVRDYTAVFQLKERVDDKVKPEETILVKFQKPFKVYMSWPAESGKQALYVDGQNDNKVLAHCPGLLGLWSWSFKPTDPVLMKNNRHPLTDIGFGHIIQIMSHDIPAALAHGEMDIIRIGDETFAGRDTTIVEARFTPHDGRKYYTSRMVCHIDKEQLLPIGIACYDDKDALEEQYSYKDVKVNVGLTENDFSRDNKAYRF